MVWAVDQQRVHFYADRAEGINTTFKVICTKMWEVGEGVPGDLQDLMTPERTFCISLIW